MRFEGDKLHIESPPMPHPNVGGKVVRVIVSGSATSSPEKAAGCKWAKTAYIDPVRYFACSCACLKRTLNSDDRAARCRVVTDAEGVFTGGQIWLRVL